MVIHLNRFPTHFELKNLKRYDLSYAIMNNGGIDYFKQKLGYQLIQKSRNYWTDKTIIEELKIIIKETNDFPKIKDLKRLNKIDLLGGIMRNGGITKFRNLLGYEIFKKPNGYWIDEIIVKELKLIIEKLNNKFPTKNDLKNNNEIGLMSAIINNGGIVKFRKILGYEQLKKPKSYWSDENIINEFKQIIEKINFFPSRTLLKNMDRHDLINAIEKSDYGTNHFRNILGYKPLKKSNGYWTEEKIINELKIIIDKNFYFPTWSDLISMNRNDLLNAIAINGGTNHFRELMGYPPSMQDKYISELSSYVAKRGRNTELIVKTIIQEWLETHNLPPLSTNVKLAPKNIIEFVCDIGKTVGIDVTNTKTKSTVVNKWRHKQYHKNLDELWIVVFSDKFTKLDYTKWNNQSPPNVYILSINNFLKELDYSTNEYLQSKIEKYNKCTFHTRPEPEKPTLTKFFNQLQTPHEHNI